MTQVFCQLLACLVLSKLRSVEFQKETRVTPDRVVMSLKSDAFLAETTNTLCRVTTSPTSSVWGAASSAAILLQPRIFLLSRSRFCHELMRVCGNLIRDSLYGVLLMMGGKIDGISKASRIALVSEHGNDPHLRQIVVVRTRVENLCV